MLKKLVALRFREMLSLLQSKKRKTSSIVGFAILYIFAALSIGFLFISIFLIIAFQYHAEGIDWVYFAFAGVMSFMLCFIGSIFLTYNQIFVAKDNEAMLAMPLKPSMILLSRIVSLIAMNYIYELIVMLPAAGVYFFVAGFSIIKLILIIVSAIFLPILSLALSMLCGWIIAFVSSRSGRKNKIVLVISALLFVLYFYFCFMWQSYMEKMAANGEAVGDVLKKALPFYLMGRACGDGNILDALIFVLIAFVPFALVYALISKSFINIATRHKGAKKIKYRGGRLKAGGARRAYAGVEIKRFTNSNVYMLNHGMGIVLMPVFAIYTLIKNDSLNSLLAVFGASGGAEIAGAGCCVVLLFCLSTVIISSAVISLDAKTLWVTKSIPLSEADILRCKLAPHLTMTLPVILLTSVILQFGVAMNIAMRAILVVLPLVYAVFMAEIGLLINLKFPKFNWTNEAVVIKQSMSAFLTMMIGLAIEAIFIVTIIVTMMKQFISITAACSVITAVLIIVTIIIYRILMTKGVKFFRELS